MSKLVTVKKPEAVKLKGVRLEWRIEDKKPVTLTITDRRGRSLTIGRGESYDPALKLMEPEPVVTEERFAVVGKVSGVEVRGVFENEHEAKNAIFDLSNGRAGDELTVKSITVPVNDDGEAVSLPDEMIPF